MKKLIIALLTLSTLISCVPAHASKVNKSVYVGEQFVSVGQSDDGKRVKVKYEVDYAGNVCTYCSTYVWDGYSWVWVTTGKDSDGVYVNYFGKKYYF
jgi:hypothetical protein